MSDLTEAAARYGQPEDNSLLTPEVKLNPSEQELKARNELSDIEHTTPKFERAFRYWRSKFSDSKMSDEQLNEKFPDLPNKFTEPMNEFLAKDIADYQMKKQSLQKQISEGPQEIGTRLKSLGHSLIGAATDPINVAAGLAVGPIVGAAASALGIAEAMGIGATAPSLVQYGAQSLAEAGLANVPAAVADVASKKALQEPIDAKAEMQSFVGSTIAAAVLFGGAKYGYNRFIKNPSIKPGETIEVKSKNLPPDESPLNNTPETPPNSPSPVTGLRRPFSSKEVELVHTVGENQLKAGQRMNVQQLINAIQGDVVKGDILELAAKQHAPENMANYDPEVKKALAVKKRIESTVDQPDLNEKAEELFKILKSKTESGDLSEEDQSLAETIMEHFKNSKIGEKIKQAAIDCVKGH